jgi:hypothetical protein
MPHAAAFLVILGLLGTGPRAEPIRLPNGSELAHVDFERHVAPLLGKMGCSAGACHGSFQGKGGFRLSLFGYDPGMDFRALTREGLGRRVNVANPDESLVLLKPTGQIGHGGGTRFAKGSWQYQVLRAWIVQGCKWEPGSGLVRRLDVQPREHLLQRAGLNLSLQARVEFSDGSLVDLTPFCDFRPRDDSIAEVSSLGQVHGLQPGDTPVIVSYRGNLTAARVLIPATPTRRSIDWPAHEDNFIDREVFAKLRRLNLTPSDLCGDTEFLRRVTIDTIGCLPAPEEVRAFLADRRPDKRTRKIEALLAHPLHAALWATKFCDMTACDTDTMDGPPELRARQAKMWHDWFRRRIALNVPYDTMVRGVLTATSREAKDLRDWIEQERSLDQAARTGFVTPYAERAGLDLFWRRNAGDDFFPLDQMAELSAAAFLGVRLECAQCHKHPFDRWTQTDYRAFANVFGQVHLGLSPGMTAAVEDVLAERRQLPPGKAGPAIPRLEEVYVSNHRARRLPHPQTREPLNAKALGGPTLAGDGDLREDLMRWLVQADNPFFARSFVNRVWAHYLGVGLVEPVDSFSLANPPSNEPLLDGLARDFIQHRFDIRQLERTILQSRTYQLSARTDAEDVRDKVNYSHAYARPMMAEVVADVLNSALGTVEDVGTDAPAGSRAIEVAPNRVRAAYLARVFRLFGRPARTTTCDCQRASGPAVPQTLFLLSDPVLLQKIGNGRVQSLLAQKLPDSDAIEEMFLATLSRFPDEQEKQAALDHFKAAQDRKTAYVDTMWALINTREFILNH